MADIFDLYNAPSEDAARMQAERVRKALRGDRTAAFLAAFSGDPVLGGVGGILGQGADQGEKEINTAIGARFKADLERKQAQELAARQEAHDIRVSQMNAAAQEAALRKQAELQAAADARAEKLWRHQWRMQEAAKAADYKRAMDLTHARGEMQTQKPLTEAQGKAAFFLQQSRNAMDQLMALGEAAMPTPGVKGAFERAGQVARATGIPSSLVQTKNQAARQALYLAIAEPIVRIESGAAVPDSEVRRVALRFIPMPGEHPEEQARKLMLLAGGVAAQMQILPEWKAKEFMPLYQAAIQFAQQIGGGIQGTNLRVPAAATPQYSNPAALLNTLNAERQVGAGHRIQKLNPPINDIRALHDLPPLGQ